MRSDIRVFVSRRFLRLALAAITSLTLAGTASAANIVNTTLLNASTNAPPDEPAGLSTNFNASSRVGGTDDPEGAFGNNNGPIEPDDFIFGDGNTVDNGNLVINDGGETVHFIEWHTTSPVTLTGYEIAVSGDGATKANRATELIRFLVEGVQVDLFDNDGLIATSQRIFGSAQTGDDFRIEFTGSTAGGPRILEINAIVPEPMTLGLLGAGSLALLPAIRRRLRRTQTVA